MRPMYGLNDALFQSSTSYREPSLGNRWIVALVNYQVKDKIEMIDIRSRKRVPLPGLNRADSQPISVSLSANGERLALIRQRADYTELLIYRRRLETMQLIELTPKGRIPSKTKVLTAEVLIYGYYTFLDLAF